ncbi:MAG TPA: sigma-70 family RNA polymerase sigma factor [Ktedonobacterales bacterium]|nr:sigma-70 family RNA polymerase sigma factor [Ktedonobacterales bacterium]
MNDPSSVRVHDEAMAADDEAALIAEAQRDPRAFDALYGRYVTRVYRYARAHTAGDEDAADLTQQVFLRALDALPRYRAGPAPFGGWLFRIARNTVVDAHRRRTSPRITLDALPEALHPHADHEPEATLLRAEALSRLRELVAALDAEKRELLALRFAARLSSPAIAAVVGKSPAAVQKQLTRILHALKEQYNDT